MNTLANSLSTVKAAGGAFLENTKEVVVYVGAFAGRSVIWITNNLISLTKNITTNSLYYGQKFTANSIYYGKQYGSLLINNTLYYGEKFVNNSLYYTQKLANSTIYYSKQGAVNLASLVKTLWAALKPYVLSLIAIASTPTGMFTIAAVGAILLTSLALSSNFDGDDLKVQRYALTLLAAGLFVFSGSVGVRAGIIPRV